MRQRNGKRGDGGFDPGRRLGRANDVCADRRHELAFHRKKPPAIGVKAPCPGFIEPELAMSVDKVPPVAFSNKATRGRNRPTA